MIKEFLPYDTVRNNALKLAHRIRMDGFIPDVIYVSLRGGAYMGNVISEYFKLVKHGGRPIYYAAVVARSYSDIRQHDRVMVDGWTYAPEHLRAGDRILLVDDIFDTGRTINHLVEIFIEKGIPRKDVKVAVHDYKHIPEGKDRQPIQPDYWCRKLETGTPEGDRWIHYMSHELVGLSQQELEDYYFKDDPDLRNVFEAIR